MDEHPIVHQMVKVFNETCCPTKLVFGRTCKIPTKFEGVMENVTWSPTKRKGGGFVFWIRYKNNIYPHPVCLKMMLEDYMNIVSKKGNLKDIRNTVTNPTKDLLFDFGNSDPQPLGQIFPTKIRELRNHNQCLSWIDNIKKKNFNCTNVLPYTPNTIVLDKTAMEETIIIDNKILTVKNTNITFTIGSKDYYLFQPK